MNNRLMQLFPLALPLLLIFGSILIAEMTGANALLVLVNSVAMCLLLDKLYEVRT